METRGDPTAEADGFVSTAKVQFPALVSLRVSVSVSLGNETHSSSLTTLGKVLT
jgi:hypothetical protein